MTTLDRNDLNLIATCIGISAGVAWMRWDSALESAVFECAGYSLENGVDLPLPV